MGIYTGHIKENAHMNLNRILVGLGGIGRAVEQFGCPQNCVKGASERA
jgi:hypothetical protein